MCTWAIRAEHTAVDLDPVPRTNSSARCWGVNNQREPHYKLICDTDEPSNLPDTPSKPGKRHLIKLADRFPEQRVQAGELPAQVYVALEACCVRKGLRVGDLQQEALHVGPLVLQELVHE